MGYPWVEAADGGTLWRSACFKDRDGYDRKDFEKDMELLAGIHAVERTERSREEWG